MKASAPGSSGAWPFDGALEPAVHDRDQRDAARRRGRQGTGAAARRATHRLPASPTRRCSSSALTHISALAGVRATAAASYQRLEFLGDHVLGLVISDMLLSRYPQGRRRRAVAAPRRSRAQGNLRRRGTEMDLGAALRLGRSGGACRRAAAHAAILADACEAIRSARSSSMAATARPRRWSSALERAHAASRCARCATPRPCCRNGRRRAACRRRPIRELARTGPHHDPIFASPSKLPDQGAPAEGSGRSKRLPSRPLPRRCSTQCRRQTGER